MSGRLDAIRENYEAQYAAASVTVPIVDGKRDEAAIRAALAAMQIIDVETEKDRKAKAILDFLAKPGGTTPSGQLRLPGFEVLPWEPDRLLRDGAGGIIEAALALPEFTSADATRARTHAREADHQATIKETCAAIHARWAADQLRRGRAILELTWGTCVTELGLRA